LHFQSDKPFKWAEDVPKGELLYMVYAIPDNCGNGSFAQASKSENASIVGKLPAGFDRWHALVGGGSTTGHWLVHTAVRDFTLAGPPGNPMGRHRGEGSSTRRSRSRTPSTSPGPTATSASPTMELEWSEPSS